MPELLLLVSWKLMLAPDDTKGIHSVKRTWDGKHTLIVVVVIITLGYWQVYALVSVRRFMLIPTKQRFASFSYPASLCHW